MVSSLVLRRNEGRILVGLHPPSPTTLPFRPSKAGGRSLLPVKDLHESSLNGNSRLFCGESSSLLAIEGGRGALLLDEEHAHSLDAGESREVRHGLDWQRRLHEKSLRATDAAGVDLIE